MFLCILYRYMMHVPFLISHVRDIGYLFHLRFLHRYVLYVTYQVYLYEYLHIFIDICSHLVDMHIILCIRRILSISIHLTSMVNLTTICRYKSEDIYRIWTEKSYLKLSLIFTCYGHNLKFILNHK